MQTNFVMKSPKINIKDRNAQFSIRTTNHELTAWELSNGENLLSILEYTIESLMEFFKLLYDGDEITSDNQLNHCGYRLAMEVEPETTESLYVLDVTMWVSGSNEPISFTYNDKTTPLAMFNSVSAMLQNMVWTDARFDMNKGKSSPDASLTNSSNGAKPKQEPNLDTSKYGSETIPFTDTKGTSHNPIVIKSPYFKEHLEAFAGGRVAYHGFKVELDKKSAGGKTGSPTYYFYAYFNRQEKEWGKSALCTMKKDYVEGNKDKIPASLLSVLLDLEMGEPKTYKEDYLVVWCNDNRAKKAENPNMSWLDDFSINPVGVVKGKTEETIVPPMPDGFEDLPSATTPETKKNVSKMFGGKTQARA